MFEKCASIISELPSVINHDNKSQFIDSINKIESIIKNTDYLLMPFWHSTWSWESAYGNGFTWESFIDEIINSGSTICMAANNADKNMAGFYFLDYKENRSNYSISVVYYD